MQPETIQLVNQFLNRTNYDIPLALVSQAVGADHKSLTNWRQRGLFVFPTEKIGGRYMVTRDAAIALGVMSELAWLLGPERASDVAKAVWENFFAARPHGLNITVFRDTVVYFRKPIKVADPSGNVPRFERESDGIWDGILGWPLKTTTSDALARQPVPNETIVMLPIGQRLAQWAAHIESALAET